MLRRITQLIPLLLVLALSGCIVFPRGGGWHDHGPRYYNAGPGPGYSHR